MFDSAVVSFMADKEIKKQWLSRGGVENKFLYASLLKLKTLDQSFVPIRVVRIQYVFRPVNTLIRTASQKYGQILCEKYAQKMQNTQCAVNTGKIESHLICKDSFVLVIFVSIKRPNLA
jgi:hypothetical protein